jgi:hypothetical protein
MNTLNFSHTISLPTSINFSYFSLWCKKKRLDVSFIVNNYFLMVCFLTNLIFTSIHQLIYLQLFFLLLQDSFLVVDFPLHHYKLVQVVILNKTIILQPVGTDQWSNQILKSIEWWPRRFFTYFFLLWIRSRELIMKSNLPLDCFVINLILIFIHQLNYLLLFFLLLEESFLVVDFPLH